MHDTLDYVSKEPFHRRWHHDELTFSDGLRLARGSGMQLSHDEVVHGKGALLRKIPGDEWQQFAHAPRALRAACGPTPASSSSSWAVARPGDREWLGGLLARLACPSMTRSTRACRGASPT